MGKHDILYKMEDSIFSYRIAGVLVRDGMVLLQQAPGDPGYAFPGGHVNFGETSQEALLREFKEEIRADIVPARLLWVMEIFFPWGDKPCHQIGMFYLVELKDETQIPLSGCFCKPDERERSASDVRFCWVPLTNLDSIAVYPAGTKERLLCLSDEIEHWVHIQE